MSLPAVVGHLSAGDKIILCSYCLAVRKKRRHSTAWFKLYDENHLIRHDTSWRWKSCYRGAHTVRVLQGAAAHAERPAKVKCQYH